MGEVENRVDPNLQHGFMAIPRNYAFSDGSIFVSYHQKRERCWTL